MKTTNEPVAVLLAAGKSTRMKTDLPKVLHELCGRPILSYVLDALTEAGVERKIVVVGFGADQVRARFASEPNVEFVEQTEQRGTGHAVLVCKDALQDHSGPVIVIAGDQPMLRPELIRTMLDRMSQTRAKAFLATAIVKNPFGLGRIIRDSANNFVRIVEQRDATPAEQAVCEINPSFYAFDGPQLFEALSAVRPNNVQKELYLTDVPGILSQRGETVLAEPLADEVDMFGINHRQHLAEAHALMQQRIHSRHLDAGVTIVDPRNTYIDARAVIGRETVIYPFTVVRGPVRIGECCRIGPFAHLREGNLDDGITIGAFVEVDRRQPE